MWLSSGLLRPHDNFYLYNFKHKGGTCETGNCEGLIFSPVSLRRVSDRNAKY